MEAAARLGDVADAFLNHDRDIYRQVDDMLFTSSPGGRISAAKPGYVPHLS